MKNVTLSDGEWKLMNLLWDEQPMTMGGFVEAMKQETGWTKSTVNVMLKRLAEKGAVEIASDGTRKLYYPLVRRDDAVMSEAKNTIKKIRMDRFGLLVSAMTQESELSDAEIDELIGILKGAKRND
ncbi:MAG: BlaI/MecI/CopY family transcriptional regulator [Clostridia bacterium]|nr:BlaI/MecI/CopY family transcriptional regulator [Clostridia bacterium]